MDLDQMMKLFIRGFVIVAIFGIVGMLIGLIRKFKKTPSNEKKATASTVDKKMYPLKGKCSNSETT